MKKIMRIFVGLAVTAMVVAGLAGCATSTDGDVAKVAPGFIAGGGIGGGHEDDIVGGSFYPLAYTDTGNEMVATYTFTKEADTWNDKSETTISFKFVEVPDWDNNTAEFGDTDDAANPTEVGNELTCKGTKNIRFIGLKIGEKYKMTVTGTDVLKVKVEEDSD